MKQFNVMQLGLAAGCTWALGMLALGLLGWLGGYWPASMDLVADWYRGFAPTFPGLILGIIWGFIDGFVGGVVFAWFFNLFGKGK